MTIILIKATNKFRNFLQMTVWKYNFQVDNFSTGVYPGQFVRDRWLLATETSPQLF